MSGTRAPRGSSAGRRRRERSGKPPRRGRGPGGRATIVVRPAALADLPGLARLARQLDTVNLPSDEAALRSMVRRSVRSFAGKVRTRAQAVYLFVALDEATRQLAGASVIVAKHGIPESPHYFLEMVGEERYSRSLRRLFRHTYLHLRRSYDGPTEVGGLIVDPAYRGHPDKIGQQLSYVRFLYMGLHFDRFEPAVIAEMLPPLTVTGESPLWECYGRRVTGLSFHEAELLCRRDKEFIEALFPQVPIYVCMLPESVRTQLGTVGPRAAAALHVLEKIGLRFLGQIDPFDGGPYYGARLSDVTLVRELRHCRVRVTERAAAPRELGANGGANDRKRAGDFLVGVDGRQGLWAARARGRIVAGDLLLTKDSAARLGAETGSRAAVVPFL